MEDVLYDMQTQYINLEELEELDEYYRSNCLDNDNYKSAIHVYTMTILVDIYFYILSFRADRWIIPENLIPKPCNSTEFSIKISKVF